MYHPISLSPILHGHTLLMPTVSIGNVGQFAVDILLHTLPCVKIGRFHHPSIKAMVGYNDQFELVTSAELYLLSDERLVILQLRAPLFKGTSSHFIKDLLEWSSKEGLKEIICIGSVDAKYRVDAQLVGPQFRYLVTPKAAENVARFVEMGWLQMEENLALEGDFKYDIHECGLMLKLFKNCVPSHQLTLLFTFSHEGDNVPDALFLVATLNLWLKLLPPAEEWKLPASWQMLYGPPPNTAIY